MATLTPAQKNRQAKLAAKNAENDEERSLANATAYERMLIQLRDHKATLKGIKGTDLKIKAKLDMLPSYDGWIDGVLTGGNGVQDDVLATCMVWHLDVGNFSEALPIAEYMLSHDLTMPDQFNRDVATVLADEIGTAAIEAIKVGTEFDVAILDQTLDLITGVDMHNQPLAKLHKARGLLNMPADLETSDAEAINKALIDLKQAIKLQSNIGVVKDIERLERKLKHLEEAAAST